MGYTKGLHEVGDGCFAYLQPDGGWGWSNAGLVVGDGASLLVDTLFDLRADRPRCSTRWRRVTAAAPIATRRQHPRQRRPLLRQPAGRAAPRSSPRRRPPRRWARCRRRCSAGLNAAPGEVGDLFRAVFGAFDFDGIDAHACRPARSTAGSSSTSAAAPVELIEVGPAHTRGDVIVHSPTTRTVFTGDILFIGGTPIVWAGPLANWIAACDLMLGMDVDDGGARPRSGHRQGRRGRRCATT